MPSARSAVHPDPFRSIDAQADPEALIRALELRGRSRTQTRLRRAFLRLVGIAPGERVVEVGCGTGVVLRDVAALVGPAGRVMGVDPSRRAVRVARALCREEPVISIRGGDGLALPFPRAAFDVALAVTVVLHVAAPVRLVEEMIRVVRPGGRVGLQDQDFGTVAVTHPDRDLTDRILRGVAARLYEEPYSGRRLLGLLRAAGLERVRLRTDVYQDTTLTPYTQTFLERRAELAVRFRLASPMTAQRWLDGFTAEVAARTFVMTMNFYGVVGVTPGTGKGGHAGERFRPRSSRHRIASLTKREEESRHATGTRNRRTGR